MTTVADRPLSRPIPGPQPSRPPRWMVAGVVASIALGVFFRFFIISHLWLDEALSVNIARLPVRSIPAALRHDGAPPLYYVLLHFWMRVFGDGDVAVRALSGVCGVAMLPPLYLAGRRIGDRRVAWTAVLIAASSPFANHYATETRMYSLVALLVVLGFLAVTNALERPTPLALVWVAVTTAALLYTHYWSIYLLATLGGWLLWRARRHAESADRRAAVRVMAAIVAGGIAFLPWLPTFLYQAAHTGTPWARPADLSALVSVIQEFAGGGSGWAQMLAFVLFSLAALGLFGRAVDHHRVELDLHTRPRARGLAAVLIGTPLVAILVGMVTGTAFVARYTSVVFPAFVLLVALGIEAFADHRTAAGMLAFATGLGFWCSLGGAVWAPRTQAGELAAAVNAKARSGDVVVFCPDQLGPAVSRLLHPDIAAAAVTYPRGTPPQRVDWVDYAQAIDASPVPAFASGLVRKAGPGHDVWLIAGKGYRPYKGRCNVLVSELTTLRPAATIEVPAQLSDFEHATLYRFRG